MEETKHQRLSTDALKVRVEDPTLLPLAKVEAGRLNLSLGDVSMNEVLSELEALVAPTLMEKRLAYEYRCCDPRYTVELSPIAT